MDAKILEFFQGIQSPLLDELFQFITFFGDKLFFVVLVSILYWCFDKKYSIWLAVTLVLSSFLNLIIKYAFHVPRPFTSMNIRAIGVETADGYSFPSGHSQSISTMFSFLTMSKRRLLPVAVMLTALVGVSRIYMGVHWPRDVVFGILIGMLIAGIMFFIYKKTSFIFVFIIMIGVAFAGIFLIEDYQVKKSASVMIGICLGTFFEKIFVKFGNAKNIMEGIARVIIGFVVAFAIHISLDYLIHDFVAIRYGIMSFALVGFIPMFYRKERRKFY